MLRHRLRFESATEAQDAHGQAIETWVEFATRWGSLEPLNGRELFTALQLHAEARHKAQIRYLAGLTAKHRIVFEGRIFNILHVGDPEERHVEMMLLLSEGLNDG